jgi:outer membrane immunogenic protein
MRLLLLLIGCLLALLLPSRAGAQMDSHFDFGGDYNFVHANAPPKACGCFSAQGGDGWAGWRFSPNLSIIGEGGELSANHVNSTPASLKIYTALGGPRYTVRSRRRLVPFGQALFGLAHGSGDLTPVTDGGPGSANVFAMTVGGGMDYSLTEGLSFRLINAEYLYTRFNNGTNNRQNNLRLAAGIVIRLGRH